MLVPTLDLHLIQKYDKHNFHEEAYSMELLNKLIFHHHAEFFLITENNDIVGYLIYGIDHATRVCDIIRVCIFDKYRHQHYAYNNLYSLIHTEDKKQLTFTLNVKITNTSAHMLYYKLGFQDYGKLENYYRDGKDAICMYYRHTQDNSNQ